MSWLFGKQKTPQEILREHQRTLRKSMREIDRERTALQRQEKQITIEIKKMAKQGQMVLKIFYYSNKKKIEGREVLIIK